MAWIQRYKVASGPRYRVFWKDPSGRQRGRVFKRLADAGRFKRSVEHSLDAGTYTDPARGKISLSDLWSEFIEAPPRPLSVSTRSLYEMQWRVHIEPRLGRRRLSSLEASDIRRFMTEMERAGVPAPSINSAFRLVRRLLSVAVEDNRIGRNPASRIQGPTSIGREMRFLTPGEVEQIADEVAEHYSAVVLTLAYTGMRVGETAALRVKNLNLLKRTISIVESAAEVDGLRVVGPTKTRQKRTVKMPSFLADALAAHLALQGRSKDPDALVFTSSEGTPLSQRAFRRAFQRACRRAGVEPLRVHDLRHTAAALAIQAGAHPKLVQDLLGHSGIGTTMNVYGHVFASLSSDLADQLNAIHQRAREDDGAVGEVVSLEGRSS